MYVALIIIVYHYLHVDVVFLVNLRHVYVHGGCHVSAEAQKEQIAMYMQHISFFCHCGIKIKISNTKEVKLRTA